MVNRLIDEFNFFLNRKFVDENLDPKIYPNRALAGIDRFSSDVDQTNSRFVDVKFFGQYRPVELFVGRLFGRKRQVNFLFQYLFEMKTKNKHV